MEKAIMGGSLQKKKNQCDEGSVDTEEKGKTGRRRPKWTKSFLANEASK